MPQPCEMRDTDCPGDALPFSRADPLKTKEALMTVRLIVNMEAATGKREELAATFASLCPSVREEPGCEQYELYQSAERPGPFCADGAVVGPGCPDRAWTAPSRSRGGPGFAAGRPISGRAIHGVDRPKEAGSHCHSEALRSAFAEAPGRRGKS